MNELPFLKLLIGSLLAIVFLFFSFFFYTVFVKEPFIEQARAKYYMQCIDKKLDYFCGSYAKNKAILEFYGDEKQ